MTDSEMAPRMHKYQMRRTALRAAADPDRYTPAASTGITRQVCRGTT